MDCSSGLETYAKKILSHEIKITPFMMFFKENIGYFLVKCWKITKILAHSKIDPFIKTLGIHWAFTFFPVLKGTTPFLLLKYFNDKTIHTPSEQILFSIHCWLTTCFLCVWIWRLALLRIALVSNHVFGFLLKTPTDCTPRNVVLLLIINKWFQ